MVVLLVIIHVFVSLFLIGVVLIQSGKGAEIGAAFGSGASQTIFGSRGPGSFLGKLTTVAAIVFILTSFSLAFFGKREGGRGSVIPAQTETPASSAQPAPAAPEVPAVPSSPAVPAAPAKK